MTLHCSLSEYHKNLAEIIYSVSCMSTYCCTNWQVCLTARPTCHHNMKKFKASYPFPSSPTNLRLTWVDRSCCASLALMTLMWEWTTFRRNESIPTLWKKLKCFLNVPFNQWLVRPKSFLELQWIPVKKSLNS